MFKLVFRVFVLSIFCSCTVSQRGQVKSYSEKGISKYSYFIYGNKDQYSIEQGTGFFLKMGKRVYFATAAHIILSWDFKNNIATYPPIDSFFVRLPKKNFSGFYFYPILVNSIRQKSQKGYAFQYPDMCLIEITNSQDYDLNILSLSSSNYPLKESISDAFIWGFPVNDTVNDRNVYMGLPPSESVGKTVVDYFKKVFWIQHGISDSINYQIKIIKGACKSGMSGSPIFIKTTYSDKLIFGGMAIMGDSVTRNMYAIRPEFVVAEIMKK